jgi:hypothetical protein
MPLERERCTTEEGKGAQTVPLNREVGSICATGEGR